MLTKKIKDGFNILENDINTYINIAKKKFSYNYYKPKSDSIKSELFNLENTLNNLKDLYSNFISIDAFLDNFNPSISKDSNSDKALNKKKKRRHKSSNKEPNENFINNRNILSGGAWESNRRRH